MQWVRYASVILLAAGLLDGCRTSPEAREAAFLRRGKEEFVKGDYRRAELEFRNAANLMPNNAEPQFQLGLAYLQSGAIVEAISSFRKALELDPKHSGAQLKLAELMTTSRKEETVKEAADMLDSVLATSSDNTEAIDAMAVAEWRLGKPEDAEKRLEGALQKFPGDLQSAVTLARLKLTRKDLTGAVEVLTRVTRQAPQSEPAALALAQLYALSNEPAEAEKEIRRALQLEPHDSNALLALGSLLMAGHRDGEAEPVFRQISALPDARFRSAYGAFLYVTGKHEAAIAEWENLLKRDDRDRTTRSQLVKAYVENHQPQKAAQILAKALKENPKDVDALFQRSEVSLKTGKLSDATQDLMQVIQMQPDSAQAHASLAAVYRAEQMLHNEQQELQRALKLSPALLPARLRLARNFLDQNLANSALEVLESAPPSQKTREEWRDERGWALLEVGDTKELRNVVNDGLAAKRCSDMLLLDAILKMRQRDFAGARAGAEAVLERNPQEVRAVRILVDSYLAQEQPDKAGERLLKLTSAHPQSAPLQQMQGEWLLSKGKLDEARKAFEAAVAADFKFLPADLSLAELDRREKHIDAARERLQTIITADPKNTTALMRSGDLEFDAGNFEGAVARYRDVLAMDSGNSKARNNLAYILASSSPDEALALVQQSNEDDPAVQDTLGCIYYHKGIYATALEYFKAAVEKQANPRRQFHLAMAYIKAGNRDRGSKLLDAALHADPSLVKTEQGF